VSTVEKISTLSKSWPWQSRFLDFVSTAIYISVSTGFKSWSWLLRPPSFNKLNIENIVRILYLVGRSIIPTENTWWSKWGAFSVEYLHRGLMSWVAPFEFLSGHEGSFLPKSSAHLSHRHHPRIFRVLAAARKRKRISEGVSHTRSAEACVRQILARRTESYFQPGGENFLPKKRVECLQTIRGRPSQE